MKSSVRFQQTKTTYILSFLKILIMKKNEFIIAMIVLTLIACTIFLSDGLTYLIAVLIGIISLSVIHLNRTRALKITRWAKTNPKKTQVLVTILQLALIAIGVFAGNNFRELGYTFSDTSAYIFSAIFAIGFASINFLPTRKVIAIPVEVFKTRLSYLAIILSSFILSMFTGNKIVDKYPDSDITHFIKSIDHKIFESKIQSNQEENLTMEKNPNLDIYKHNLTNNTFSIASFAVFTTSGEKINVLSTENLKKESRDKIKAEKKANKFEKRKMKLINRLEKRRLAFGAAISAGAVLLIILLVLTLCGGVCLMIAGFGGSGAGYVLLGAVVTAASIFGIIKIAKSNKRKNKVGS